MSETEFEQEINNIDFTCCPTKKFQLYFSIRPTADYLEKYVDEEKCKFS